MRSTIVLCLVLGGCAEAGARFGELGVVELAYADQRRECASDCDPALPLAAGGLAVVQIENGAVLPALDVRSADPSVLTAEMTPSRTVFVVAAHAPGATHLEFLDADTVVDRFRMEVRTIDAIAVTAGSDATSALTGEIRDIRFDLFDASRSRLRGFGALTAMAPDRVRVDQLTRGERTGGLPPDYPGPNHEIIGFAGDLEGGSERVSLATMSGARLDLDFPIALPIVSRIRLTTSDAENAVIVVALIELANPDPGITACCVWSFEPADASVSFTNGVCESVRVASIDPSAPQTASVTCTSRGVSERVDIRIPAGP